MPEGMSATRYLIHKACAYPLAISWIIGTLLIWTPISITMVRNDVFEIWREDWTVIPLLLLCYLAASGLGLIAGAALISWPVARICGRLNGAPHAVGEKVLVLSGPHSGKAGCIYEITTGQGGHPLPRVKLGDETLEDYCDLFEEYELLRLPTPHDPPLSISKAPATPDAQP